MKSALAGRRIVVTRPTAQALNLVDLIRAAGGEPIALPLLEIAPAVDATALARTIARLADYALAIFVSPNAVAHFVAQLRAQGGWPPALRAAAIGGSTAAALADAGVSSIVAPAGRFDSEALLELPELSATAIVGRRVLIVRGNGGRELIAETLHERGAIVDAVAAYERSPAPSAAAIVSLLRNKKLDALTISSSEGLRVLFAMLDTDACASLRATPTFVSHQRINALAVELGLRRVILTAPGDAALVAELCKYNWPSHER
jgi:uroporphyrinogen-III synthase